MIVFLINDTIIIKHEQINYQILRASNYFRNSHKNFNIYNKVWHVVYSIVLYSFCPTMSDSVDHFTHIKKKE